MKFVCYIPVTVVIEDPIAALDQHIENWKDDDPDIVKRDSASPSDLLNAAIWLEGATIELPDDADQPEFVLSEGRILADEWTEPLSRAEIEEIEAQ